MIKIVATRCHSLF